MLTTTEAGPRHRAGRPRANFLGRVGLATADHLLSGAANLLLLVVAAHALTALDFGRFTLVFLIVMVTGNVVHAGVAMPALVHPEDVDQRPGIVLGTALVVGGVPSALTLAAGLVLVVVGDPLGPAIAVLGLCLPLMLLMNVGRYLALATRRPGRALMLDVTAIAITASAYGVLLTTGRATLTTLVWAWCVAGALTGLAVFAQYGVPRPADFTTTWLRERWQFTWRTVVGAASTNGGALLMAVLASLVSSPMAVAALRGSLLLARPAAMAQGAIAATTAADVARDEPDDRGLRRYQLRALAVTAAVAGLNLLALVLLPDAVGRAILGNVWPLVEPLRLAIGLSVVALALQSGVRAVIFGRRQAQLAMVTDLVGMVLLCGAVVVGAALDGAAGGVWGLVVGQVLVSVAWWVAFAVHLDRRARRPFAPRIEGRVAVSG